jgi:hypothetical protein
MYIITGGAGARLRVRDMSPNYTAHYNSTYHFITVEIDVRPDNEKTTLTLETWAMPIDYKNIFLIDNFTIIKNYKPLTSENGDKRVQIIGFEPKILITVILLISLISLVYIRRNIRFC